MFLENLLYQVDNISQNRIFSYPCSREGRFSYIACEDLGEVVAKMFANHSVYDDTRWTARTQASISDL